MPAKIAYRPTIAEIDLDALRANVRLIQSKTGEGIALMPVIKANAYGHGGARFASALVDMGIKHLALATVEEGIELRDAGIRVALYVLGGLIGAQPQDLIDYGLTPVIHQLADLQVFAAHLKQTDRVHPVHIKLDSGMGRLGFQPSELEALVQALSISRQLQVKGVMTHLARADEPNPQPTERQFQLFERLQQLLQEKGVKTEFLHIANSAAIIEGRLQGYNMVRPGIMLYGACPHERHRALMELAPVMTLKTKLLGVKDYAKGAVLGYGGTFMTQRESRIGILPIGYADGYPRLLSNRGSVLLRGLRAPIVGRISMDLTLIDITDIEGAMIGDEVILIGSQGGDRIRAEEVAQWAETISYEIFCGISARVPRVYLGS